MLLDLVQLGCLVTVVTGVWAGLFGDGRVGVGMILTGLVVFAAALWVEHEVDG